MSQLETSRRPKRQIRSRCAAADRQLAAALGDRAAVEQAAEAFVAATWDVQHLKPAQDNVQALLVDADRSDRKVERASKALSSIGKQVNAWAEEATEMRHRVVQRTAAAKTEAEQLASQVSASLSTPTAPAPTLPAAPAQSANGPDLKGDVPDVFEQIRKLGDLRAEGLITPEEFEAKKTDLLSRL